MKRTARALFMAVVLVLTLGVAAPAQEPHPGLKTIHSNMYSQDSVFTWGWAIGSFLTLTVDDPTTPDSPDLTIPSIEVVEDSFQIDLGSANLPGHEVSLTDGTTVVDHVVGPLQITSADRATGLVTGIATPDIPVELIPTDGEDFLGVYNTDPEADGSWQIQVPAGTLAAAKWLMSNQFETADPDEDSETQYDWYFSEPSMSVTANGDRVEGFDWPEGADVTLTIDDPDTTVSPDYTASETVGNDPAGSIGNVGFVFGDAFDVQPGHLATLDDGQTVVSHVVQTVEVTDVDAAADTVSGTADVGDKIRVFADSGNGIWDVTVETQPGGTWVASFADILDLVPGIGGGAIERDPDPAVPAVTIFGWDVQEQAYVFSGFAAPVDTDAVNVARAGRTVPLKFRVTTGAGDPVTDIADVAVTVTTLECELGTTEDQVEEYAAGNSGLQNLGDGYYQYNWKTPKSYRNSCKLLTLDIGDGVPHTAAFHFTR